MFFVARRNVPDDRLAASTNIAIGTNRLGLGIVTLDGYSKRLGHSHEVGERLCTELFHDIVAMHFQRDFADPEFGSRMPVHQTRAHKAHDLLLTSTKRIVAFSELVAPQVIFSPEAILVECGPNGVQEFLFAYWFLRGGLHRPDHHTRTPLWDLSR